MTVDCEAVKPEAVVYQRGTVYIRLNGFHAWLYRGMVWQYGEAEATERFWWLWHKKAVDIPQISTASIPSQGNI